MTACPLMAFALQLFASSSPPVCVEPVEGCAGSEHAACASFDRLRTNGKGAKGASPTPALTRTSHSSLPTHAPASTHAHAPTHEHAPIPVRVELVETCEVREHAAFASFDRLRTNGKRAKGASPTPALTCTSHSSLPTHAPASTHAHAPTHEHAPIPVRVELVETCEVREHAAFASFDRLRTNGQGRKGKPRTHTHTHTYLAPAPAPQRGNQDAVTCRPFP